MNDSSEYVSIVSRISGDSIEFEVQSVDDDGRILCFDPSMFASLFSLTHQGLPPLIVRDEEDEKRMQEISGFKPRIFLVDKKLVEKKFACEVFSMHNMTEAL